MKEKRKPVVEDASALARFINSTGEISEALYLARHPEEKEEASPATVAQNQRA